MAQNRNFGKGDGKGGIQYAPSVFNENEQIIVPNPFDEEIYFARGWLKVVDIKPEVGENQCADITGWTEDLEAKTITAQYTVVDIPPPKKYVQVRRFSKLRLVEFCMERGIWEGLKSYITELGYYDLFVMAMVFLENDKFFTAGLEAYKQLKISEGMPEEEIQAIIDAALDYAFDAYEQVEVDGQEAEEEAQAEEL